MSEIKIKQSENFFYSDTDSIDLNVILPTNYVSNELGEFKSKNKSKKVVYIAHKVYAAITENNEEYIKVKRLKKHGKFNYF